MWVKIIERRIFNGRIERIILLPEHHEGGAGRICYEHIWADDIHISPFPFGWSTASVGRRLFNGRIRRINLITLIPADDPQRLRPGWVIHEDIGIVVIQEGVELITIN